MKKFFKILGAFLTLSAFSFGFVACSDGMGGGGGEAYSQGSAYTSTLTLSLSEGEKLSASKLTDLHGHDVSDWFTDSTTARTVSDGLLRFKAIITSVTETSIVISITGTTASKDCVVTLSLTIPKEYTASGNPVEKRNVKTITIGQATIESENGTSGSGTNGNGASGSSGGLSAENPVSYGTSRLPNLSSSSGFSGQSFIEFDDDNSPDEGYFFCTDGTISSKGWQGNRGTNESCRFWRNYAKASYTYNPATKMLNLKLKGFYADDDTLVTSADEYVSLIKKHYESKYATVNIAPEYIAAEKQWFSYAVQQQDSVVCSISDGALVFTDSTANEGKYRYTEGNLRIDFSCKQGHYLELSIDNDDACLNRPIIMSMGNGTFSGSDFDSVRSDDKTTITITKLGDFSGTYSEQSDGCHFTLTSATGDIDEKIKVLIGTTYILPQRTDEKTEFYLYPVLKTVNYTVIGSDGEIATTNSQGFITDASETLWSLDTLQVLSANYIEGIYATKDCAQSVIGTTITDGSYVYVKLQKLSAKEYRDEVFLD